MAGSFSSELLPSPALLSGVLRGAVFHAEHRAGARVSRCRTCRVVLESLLSGRGVDTTSCGEQMRNDARPTSRCQMFARWSRRQYAIPILSAGRFTHEIRQNFPGIPESWIPNPWGFPPARPGLSMRVPDRFVQNHWRIQHVVQRWVLKSICSREHTVNREESSIRRRFVPWLFRIRLRQPQQVVQGIEGAPSRSFSCRRPLRLARCVGMCLPPA